MPSEEDELVSRAQGRVGSVLRGKYRLDRVLGVGGMAVVYKATHRNEAEFAVKMLHPELSIRDEIRTRFLREGKAANSVKHPGAVLVVDDDVAEDGAAFLVMELLAGAEVESLWERCGYRLPVPAVLSIGEQLLDVLAAAHAKGIVHRDIKPANVFATRDGTLKVLDFGIARVRDAAATSHAGLVTGTGMLLGTPAFMAPEQAFAKASEIDAQTDVWAVGATMFTLLTGDYVHVGENASQLMVRAATERARPIRSVAAEVPPPLAAVIDRALAFEKAARWPSAATMRQALQRAAIESFGKPSSKDALAPLVEGGALASTERELPLVAIPTPNVTATPRSSTVGMTEAAPMHPSSVPRVGGGTTAQPVFMNESVGTRQSARSRRRTAMGIGIGLVATVVIGVGGVAMHKTLAEQPSTAVQSAGTPANAAPAMPPPTSEMLPPPASTTSAAHAADTEAGSLAAGAVTAGKPPQIQARPSSPGVAGPIAPTVQATTAPPPASPIVAPVPAPTPTLNCDPPTWTDAAGHVHLKQGCR